MLKSLAITLMLAAAPVSEYVDFLYESMPLNDSIDHPRSFWTANVETALQARREMPWGAKVPEREFRHFVLPVRVNNEDLDSSRMVFYRELAPRVRNLSIADAALEVNHWLHEKATYKPSDSRTSSPLATVRTTLGRCGEESTLGVAAFRAVGIPARQVYTPRWAHTDDNHAWVEVWVDGRWHFLGACEPEPLLDMAWFNAPAARGMMMCTNAFGRYDGPEQKLYTDSCYTRINITSNYAPVHRPQVTVLDSRGKPSAGAEVSFRLYNYAEFYPLFTTRADSKGRAQVECGRGDIVVWARNDAGQFNFAVIGATDSVTTLRLMTPEKFAASMPRSLAITPPRQTGTLPAPTAAQVAENNRRKVEEDSIRNSVMSYFYNDSTAAEMVSDKRAQQLLKKACGNGDIWTLAMLMLDEKELPKFVDWAGQLTDKDLRDINLEVIYDAYPRGVNPRIANEFLTPFCAEFDTLIHEPVKDDIVGWVSRNITVNNARNPFKYPISPGGVLRSRVADEHSRDILFVALCRYYGIAAQLDPVTGRTQWNPDGRGWQNVTFGTDESSTPKPGYLNLTYQPGQVPRKPAYYQHFTISKIENGAPQLMEFPEDATIDNFGHTALEPGSYLLTSGRRLADGGVLCRTALVNISEDATTEAELVIDSDEHEISVVGSVNSDPLLPLTGRGFFIAAVVSPGHEPTQHLLNELRQNREAFEAWGKKIVLTFADAEAASRLDPSGLPTNVVIVKEPNPTLLAELAAEFEFDPATLPAVIVGDTFNRVVFHSEGYAPGLGSRLLDIISRLPE